MASWLKVVIVIVKLFFTIKYEYFILNTDTNKLSQLTLAFLRTVLNWINIQVNKFNAMKTHRKLINTKTGHPCTYHRELKAADNNLYACHINNLINKANSNGVKLLIGFLVMLLSLLYIPAHAAANDNEERNPSAQTKYEPDNLADYAAQKIETIKNKNIDLSEIARETINPTEQTAVQQAGHLQGEASLTGEYNESYYPLDALNSGLPSLSAA